MEMTQHEVRVPYEQVGKVMQELMDTVAYHVEAVLTGDQDDGMYLVTWESEE